MKRATSYFLAVVLTVLVAISFVGCKQNTLMINGVEISKFSIVYSEEDTDYSFRAAEFLKSQILTHTGIELSLVEDGDEPQTEYEIVVGETAREISSTLNADTVGTQFSILAQEKQIALEGDYFMVAAAAYFFAENYIKSDGNNVIIPKETKIYEPIVKTPKNIIMLIGDGMGVQQTKLFESQEDTLKLGEGEDIFYGYYLPHQAFSRTDSLSGTTDSAAGATALACGQKTLNGCIGRSADKKNLQSLTELAASLGKGTAVMSTEESVGATPASFSAHCPNRECTSIILADQKNITDNFGTVINCGYDYYTVRGIDIIEKKVVETIDKIDDNEKGFFMMYEEAYIDKHCHSNDKTNAFRAVVRFNQVIGRVMEYAFYNPETLVLITADHETGGLTVNESGKVEFTGGTHTSADVPVFAYGFGAEVFDGKTVENIQIPQTLAKIWGVADFGDQSQFKPLN